jgi:hypothetical protein
MGYSIQIKETVLQKALSGRRIQHEIATEFGVGINLSLCGHMQINHGALKRFMA